MAAEPRPVSPWGIGARVLGMVAVTALVGLLVYGITARSPDTTIDDALSRQQAVAAPALEADVLTAGEPGPLRQRWSRAARDGRIDLRELRGVPVVLNFWASWCDPCRQEAPVLERGWRASRPGGVLFLGLNMQDVRQDALSFVRGLRQDYPVVRDPGNQIARRWGVTGLPETFFISRRGEVVNHVIGTVTDGQLNAGIIAAVNGRPRGANDGGARRPTR